MYILSYFIISKKKKTKKHKKFINETNLKITTFRTPFVTELERTIERFWILVRLELNLYLIAFETLHFS